MPEMTLVAEAGCVPPEVLSFIAAGLDLQMRRDIAPKLQLGEPWTVSAMSSLDGVLDLGPGVRKVLTFKPNLGITGASGFHSTRAGISFAEALPPRVNGATIDATTASHELIETYGDPGVDMAFPMADGAMVDFELADPVEADAYPESIRIGPDVRVVMLSNFVLPGWFDLGDGAPYDFLGRVSKPWEMSPGGYFRRVTVTGKEEYVYSDDAARAQLAAKLANPTSRVSRRRASSGS